MPRTLRFGSIGEDVRQVQSMLNGQPTAIDMNYLAEDAIFGPLTQAQVVAYQRLHGLAPDGVVGPMTWDMLKSNVRLVPASPVLRRRVATARPGPLRPYG